MRKHFYLITEHENEDRVGAIMTMDSRRSRPTKNNEAPSHRFNEDTGDFEQHAMLVGMGYEDFDDEDDLDARIKSVIKSKLGDLDGKWLVKADVKEALEA